jgi:hypothetical protein
VLPNANLIRRRILSLAEHYEGEWLPELKRLLPLLQQIPGWLDKFGWLIPALRPSNLPAPVQLILSHCQTFSADQWQPALTACLEAVPDERLISFAQWLGGVGPWLASPEDPNPEAE